MVRSCQLGCLHGCENINNVIEVHLQICLLNGFIAERNSTVICTSSNFNNLGLFVTKLYLSVGASYISAI